MWKMRAPLSHTRKKRGKHCKHFNDKEILPGNGWERGPRFKRKASVYFISMETDFTDKNDPSAQCQSEGQKTWEPSIPTCHGNDYHV